MHWRLRGVDVGMVACLWMGLASLDFGGRRGKEETFAGQVLIARGKHQQQKTNESEIKRRGEGHNGVNEQAAHKRHENDTRFSADLYQRQ